MISRPLLGLCLGGALAAVAPAAASAQAVEFFKCTLAEGASIQQLTEATRAFLKDAEGVPAMEGYSVRFLTPLYASDISHGSFYWVGIAADFAALGAANDYWDSEANAAHRRRFGELSSDCEASSAYRAHPVETEED